MRYSPSNDSFPYLYFMQKFTNSLSKETSPYLLQHAHNPVNWVAWSTDVFDQAKAENKLVLISIGYSACHWCHVMEHECFEDEEVAQLMNKYFINVKVDREERPDVDQVYMTAVQIMTQKGGWPLNCFTLPDGRPIYGGTYFPKDQWMHILNSLQHTFTNDLEKVEEYAESLHEGIVQSELIDILAENLEFTSEKLHELVTRWARSFDSLEGGSSRAPKFPLPNNYEFLLQYAVIYDHAKVLNHVELTLDKMAMGGIYDQIGGGFTRYSVDMLWKVPHFEKMLYDNGQLLSLYAQGYKKFKKPLYKRIVFQTIEWLNREMLHPEGAYFAALDADSEGEEGKFYCWNKEDFELVTEEDANWAVDFYSVNRRGFWEDEKYIPLRTETDEFFRKKQNWSLVELEENIAKINEKLLKERNKRVRPGLDSKCLTSWNALLISGLCDAHQAFSEPEFKLMALKIGRWITTYQLKNDGKLFRNRTNGVSAIDGFLEDYACTIQAFISLYEITFDEDWIIKANDLLKFTQTNFQHPESKMFYFTSNQTELIARKMEINDNVLPSSNSMMARNLWKLGSYFYENSMKNEAKQLLANVYEGMEMYGSGYSNWGILAMNVVNPYYEIVVAGDEKFDLTKSLQSKYLPNTLFAGGKGSVPILEGKIAVEPMIFACVEGACQLPTNNISEVLKIVLK